MKLVELDEGSRGQQVQWLQHMLNTSARLRPPLDLDGAFGPLTDRAVRRYQERRGLAVDGIVGRDTWAALGARTNVVPAPRVVPRNQPTRSVATSPLRRAIIQTTQPERSRRSTPPLPANEPSPNRRMRPIRQPAGTDIGAPWMRFANAEMGVAEIKRRGEHNKRIVEYHSATSLGARTDEVAWCASFVNWCLREAGVSGNRSARAKDFGSWGQALDQPRYGCVVHLYKSPRRGVDGRTGSSSGNHVAFFISQTATHVRLLGGNQGDQVRESNYPLSQYKVVAMRWPTGR